MTHSSLIMSALLIAAVTAGCGGQDGGDTGGGSDTGGGGTGGSDTGGGGTGGSDTGGGGAGGADACAGVVCEASDQCHVAGTCDPKTGLCSDPSAEDGAACDDDDACTQTDTCTGGACLGGDPVTCTAQGACQVAGTCDPATGMCSEQTVAADDTPCPCGACLQGECRAVTVGPTTIGQGNGEPVSIDVDADNIYFANLGSGVATNGSVGSLPKGGGMPQEIALGLTNASSVVVTGDKVYFSDESYNVWSAPKDASAPATVLVPPGIDGLRYLATDGVNLYWFGATSGAVSSLPLAGGAPKTIAVDQPGSSRVISDGKNVYWTNTTDKSIRQVAIDGGAITTLVSNQPGFATIAVDATSVYWTDGQAGTVMKVPIGGGVATTIASGQQVPNSLTVAGTTVYWTNFGNGNNGTVAKASIDGGTVTMYPGVVGELGPVSLIHDAECIYWANYASSTIRSAPR
jgi:hypothetical protein